MLFCWGKESKNTKFMPLYPVEWIRIFLYLRKKVILYLDLEYFATFPAVRIYFFLKL